MSSFDPLFYSIPLGQIGAKNGLESRSLSPYAAWRKRQPYIDNALKPTY